MPTLEADMRRRIAGLLPDAMAKALASYQIFLDEGAQENTKEFKAHHDACKIAIAHVQLLIDLAQWADLPDQGEADDVNNGMLAALIDRAQSEINSN